MLRSSLVAVSCVVALAGCGSNLCEKSQSAQKKFAGDCGADAPALLGTMCTANLSQCSAADQKILETTVACMDKLPACVSIAKDAWKLQRDGCLTGTDQLSKACLDAFFMGNPPGFDAGLPDAGAQSINDGGNGLTLFAAANEDTVALAWEARRTANVEKWLLVETDGVGENRKELEITPGTSIHFTIPDAGMASRRYFIAGLNANGDVLTGTPIVPAGTDAGLMCMGPTDCAPDKVCDLGQCKTQTCVSGGTNTCPVGYGCLTAGYCQRTSADGGMIIGGGGTRDAGSQPLPMISQELGLTPRPPMSPGSLAVGLVAGKRPDIAAFDTARVALALEQEGQLIAHPSSERGGDLGDERFTSFGLDTTGARVHLAWDFETNSLFACYVVGTGVRVQKSADRGRTWGQVTNTFMPALTDDGGIGEIYRDCDLAPWKNGGVLVVTAEDEKLTLRELDAMLNVAQKTTAFVSQPPTDAGVGGIMAPSHPAIATAPAMNLVHVTFTGTRLLSGGIGDTEPYGVVRAGTAGFGMPSKLTPVLGSAYPEDWTAVAIHPKTGQAVAAFTTILNVNAQQFSTVFVALYSTQVGLWSTGSHLNVLVVDQNTTVLFPQKPAADTWFAYSPSLAPLGRDNLFALSFVAGKRDSTGVGDYRQYLVPFDLDRVPDITAGRGWFVPPVTKVSDVRVLDPRGSLGAPQPPVSAIATDSQISAYGVFIEGAGVAGDVEAPAQYFHWP
ncbi:MAG: hypothetical protein U0228_20545 [Myxococcaceae bacterium]